MSKIISKCPSCNSKELQIDKIECSNCQTRFEGKFKVPSLLLLSDEDLEFMVEFTLCSGSLKDMGKLLGVSYPTLRNQLNQIVDRIKAIRTNTEEQKEDILKQLGDGKISVQDAAKMLNTLAIQ